MIAAARRVSCDGAELSASLAEQRASAPPGIGDPDEQLRADWAELEPPGKREHHGAILLVPHLHKIRLDSNAALAAEAAVLLLYRDSELCRLPRSAT